MLPAIVDCGIPAVATSRTQRLLRPMIDHPACAGNCLTLQLTKPSCCLCPEGVDRAADVKEAAK